MNNLTMDFYELTMGQAYFDSHKEKEIAYFDVFYRKVPDQGSFVIAYGINKIVEYIKNFHIDESDISYLRSLKAFSEDFLDYLSKVRFSGDMWSVEEGSVIIPNEPVITIKAPIIEAQLLETAILMLFNHNSLIATKAYRIVHAAQGRAVMEFGSRRAHGEDAAVEGALAAIMVGAAGTACTETGKKYGVKILGTMAHAFVQSFASEYEAFKAYATSFPDDCTLLVDTYHTLNSGIPNAIKIHNEILKPMGKELKGIRIDSGDLAILSSKARKMLDDAGLKNTKIIVSNALDEFLIQSLLVQKAPIDSFGVGEKLITASSEAVLGGVYKLCAVEENGKIIPKIKISDNEEKVINPSFKKIYRLYDENGQMLIDIVSLYNEGVPNNNFSMKLDYCSARDIRVKMFENGKLIYRLKNLEETKEYIQKELATLSESAKRLNYPQVYNARLTDKLFDLKKELIEKGK